MKTVVKVGLGMLVGGIIGAVAACLGKKNDDDNEVYVSNEIETEETDSDSETEEEE